MTLRSKLEYGLIAIGLVGTIGSGIKGCYHSNSYFKLKPTLAQCMI